MHFLSIGYFSCVIGIVIGFYVTDSCLIGIKREVPPLWQITSTIFPSTIKQDNFGITDSRNVPNVNEASFTRGWL